MLRESENLQFKRTDQEAFDGLASINCPTCGRENASESVFCATTSCHKALGEFKYVQEELKAETRWHEALAAKVSSFIGNLSFLVVHAFWFAIWVAVNTGILAFFQTFDAYPFGLLGIILAIEAIFITGILLISQNRQSAHADKRAELDYEVNVRTYREIRQIKAMLQRLECELKKIEAVTQSRQAP
ncbi:MAG TPA: DUF1003 domain-containing protein [Pyrinomonadaceae bacterium]|nr:DUF1003 domain-containing protein [Pyrinomonadaceae bacterium]